MAIITNAQIGKGSLLLGGNIGFGKSKQTNSGSDAAYRQSSFSISPALGFVTADNKEWGIALHTSFQKTKASNQPSQNQYNGYGGSVFHRRYLTLGKGFYLFGQAAAGYRYTKQKYNSMDNVHSVTTRTDLVSVTAFPGVTYAVSKNFHLEAGLNDLLALSYSAQNETTVNGGAASAKKTKNLNFDTNFSNSNPITLGFRFVL